MNCSIGKRVFFNVERPAREIVDQFKNIPSSNLGDVMERLYCTDSSIFPLNDTPMLGVAFTVKCPAGDNLLFHRALDLAQPGDVLVIDGQGCMERALAGEIMMHYCQSRGIAGVVVNGCMRDRAAIAKMKIPVYCKGITPQGPYKHGPGEINVPVCVGGQVVQPGDILVGDQDGIVVIRPEDAAQILQQIQEKLKIEAESIANYSSASPDYNSHIEQYKDATETGYSYFEN